MADESVIRPYNPTIRERMSEAVQAGLEKLGSTRGSARRQAQSIMGGPQSNLPLGLGIADVVPLLGTGLQTEEAIRGAGQAVESAKRGDLIDAGVEGVFAALGLVPGAAGTAKALQKIKPYAPESRRLLQIQLNEMLSPSLTKAAKEPRYETAQEGPFYKVKPRIAKSPGSKDRGVREEVRAADVAGGSSRGDVPQPISDEEIGVLIKDPSNFVYRAADEYSNRVAGQGYKLPEMPPSSLAKQSAIGRTFQLAADGDDAYKKAVFEAYGKSNPELIEASGAQNYDQLMEAAYRQLAKETADQFHALPVNMSYHRAGEGNYQSSSEMLRDVYGNRHLYVYQGGDPHDFLNAVDPETGLNTNEMFRAVHDFYGHAVHGNPFGPKGEEIAYGAHAQMFSPLARLAMAGETRGQNSFVNYTPINAELKQRINRLNEARYEANRRGQKADVAEIDKLLGEAWQNFQFAPQKSVLLPPEFLDVAYTGGMPDYVAPLIQPKAGTTAAEMLTHFSHSPELQMLDPSRYGTGIKGREMERLMATQNPVMGRSYFYTGDPRMVRPEGGLGPFRYGAKSEGLYDISEDPMMLRVLAAEANRAPFTAKYNKGLVNPDQAVTDLERLVKEYGYEGLMNPQQGVAIMYEPTPVQPFAAGGLAAGGLKEAVKKKAKEAVEQVYELLSPEKRKENLERFLEPSAVKVRLYHGTKATEGDKGQEAVRSIRPSKEGALGSGAYLTPSSAYASGYSGSPNAEAIQEMLGNKYQAEAARKLLLNQQAGNVLPEQVGGNMLPVYAQLRNPLMIHGTHIDPMVEALMKLGLDEKKASKMVERAYEQKGYIGKEVENRARAAGYDGLMQYRNGDLSEVVVYNPNAIKSAIGNRGTYDTSHPDLSKARGGLAAIKRRR